MMAEDHSWHVGGHHIGILSISFIEGNREDLCAFDYTIFQVI